MVDIIDSQGQALWFFFHNNSSFVEDTALCF